MNPPIEDVEKLPIDVVPKTNPPIFRWSQTVDTPIGKRVMDLQGQLPPNVEDAVLQLIVQAKELAAECVKLQAFKDWVHAYLDNHDVPHHPPGTHGAVGCRIGDRMDWLMEQLAEARKLNEKPNVVVPQTTSSRKSKG